MQALISEGKAHSEEVMTYTKHIIMFMTLELLGDLAQAKLTHRIANIETLLGIVMDIPEIQKEIKYLKEQEAQ